MNTPVWSSLPFLSLTFQGLPPDSPHWATWIAAQGSSPEHLEQVVPHLHGDPVAKGIEALVSPVISDLKQAAVLHALRLCCAQLLLAPRSPPQRVALERALFRLVRPDHRTPNKDLSSLEQIKVVLPLIEWEATPGLANRLLEQAAAYGVLPPLWGLLKDRYDPAGTTLRDSLPRAVLRGTTEDVFARFAPLAHEAIAHTRPSALGAAFVEAVLQKNAGMVACLVPYVQELPIPEIRASFSGPFAALEEADFIQNLNAAIASAPDWLSSPILGRLAHACKPFQADFPALEEVFQVFARADDLAQRPAVARPSPRRRT